MVKKYQPNCLVNSRIGNGLGDYSSCGDNCLPEDCCDELIEAPITLNHTWGYKAFDNDWKSPEMVLEILEKCNEIPSEDKVFEAISSFIGEIEQIPPLYSAINVGGVKLVDLAREGITIERKSRNVNINSIESEKISENVYKMRISCSKGTYIRTLCADIGEKLGCGACMCSLSRTEVGVFKREDAIVFDNLNDMTQDEILSYLIPVENMFMHLKEARMDEFFNRLYFHGEKIKLGKLRGIYGEVGEMFRVYDENGFYSLGEITESDGIKYFRQKKLFR
jgi:tRNA pseudouridine55 synthase